MNNHTTHTEQRIEITRTAETPSFMGYHFVSWNHARSVLDISDFKISTIISDISQGAWKGHWIASELQLQLDLPINTTVQPLLNQGDYADTVTKLIDNESTGNKNFSLALESCRKIKSKLLEDSIKFIVVIPPGIGYEWEDENLEMMKLLYDAFRKTDIQIILFCHQQSNIPPSWQVNFLNKPQSQQQQADGIPFFPGIATHHIAENLGVTKSDLAFLRGGHVAINPLLPRQKQIDLQQFQACYLKDYLRVAFYPLLPDVISPEEVEMQAIQRFAEGGYGIAIRLLSSLLAHINNPYDQSLIIAQIQNMRIALLKFADAAIEAPPDESLPDMIKASLYQSKAWGLVMNNKSEEAEPYFEKARLYLDAKKFSRLYLYLLNISALNKLRIGAIDEAFAYEKKIEASLDKLQERDWHITYINNINQARLYKKIKNYPLSESYYKKAFAINTQLKNESDLLYTNFCYAQLEELKGNQVKSFIFFLRACIHWLSNEIPEALAPRVAQAIFNKGLETSNVDVEEISHQLKTGLQNIANKANIYISPKITGNELQFTRSDKMEDSLDIILGQPGWTVCVSDKQIQPVFSGSSYDGLKSLVTDIIKSYFPNINWLNYKTVITDTQFSCELPANLIEMILVSKRLNIFKLVWCEKSVMLTEKELNEIDARIKVEVSPAINFVGYENGKMKVYFRRYKSPLLLTANETRFMQYLQETGIGKFQEWRTKIDLKMMEEKRLIQLYYE
jgi:hypothetical protein